MRKEISWSLPFRATRAECRYSVLARDRVTAQKLHDRTMNNLAALPLENTCYRFAKDS